MLAHMMASLRAEKPRMALLARSVVEATALIGGSLGSADVVARRLGLRNRFALARLLRREGLPPLHRLSGWATVLSWLEKSEQQHLSLCQLAFHSGRHPAACYRLVREVTGTTWDHVRRLGARWAAAEFMREVHAASAAATHGSGPAARGIHRARSDANRGQDEYRVV